MENVEPLIAHINALCVKGTEFDQLAVFSHGSSRQYFRARAHDIHLEIIACLERLIWLLQQQKTA